jgi:LysM repeat protein
MKWRHWSILIVLLLLNYIIFSTAFTKLADQNRPGPRPTRTAQPTFQSVEPTLSAWKVLSTSTPLPTRTPFTPMPTKPVSSTIEITSTVQVMPTVQATIPPTAGAPATDSPPPATASPLPNNTSLPPTATSSGERLSHTVKSGETLSEIAKTYGVSVQAIMDANGLPDPNRITTGQVLTIPAPGEVPPAAAATSRPQATNTPRPAATKAPTPKPTPKPATSTPAPASLQFTAQVIWDQAVAPNCGGPAIAKQSEIKDTAGNPVNGARVEVDCYGNKFSSHPSGTPGEYDAGHYDFAFGQTSPQDWTCTARVLDVNGQAVTSSEVVTIHFDTNNCKPGGDGHQVATVNWTKHW